MRVVLLALGANRQGPWGTPAETLRRALWALFAAGIEPRAVSGLYLTAPEGPAAQSDFHNAVISVRTNLPPAGLMRALKGLEAQAGRRMGRRWGPRPLDIDILADPGGHLGWSRRKRVATRGGSRAQPSQAQVLPRSLVIPHPRLHQRAFVLVPLLDIAPRWQHPVLKCGARALLRRLGPQRRTVRRIAKRWADHRWSL